MHPSWYVSSDSIDDGWYHVCELALLNAVAEDRIIFRMRWRMRKEPRCIDTIIDYHGYPIVMPRCRVIYEGNWDWEPDMT